MNNQKTAALNIVNIEIIGQEMSFTPEFKPVKIYDFGLEIESKYDESNKLVIVKLIVEIRAEGYRCASQTAQYWFNVEAYQDTIKRNAEGHFQIPRELQVKMNDIVINTARGLLYAEFKGTLLHDAILPVIDPAAL
jgi:hypothetical protein